MAVGRKLDRFAFMRRRAPPLLVRLTDATRPATTRSCLSLSEPRRMACPIRLRANSRLASGTASDATGEKRNLGERQRACRVRDPTADRFHSGGDRGATRHRRPLALHSRDAAQAREFCTLSV